MELTDLSRSDWADLFVKIDGKPIDWTRYQHILAPLDSNARRIAVKKGSQIGFSILLIVRALHDCIEAGKDAMIVEPTKEDVKDFQTRVVAITDDIDESVRGDIGAREGLIQFKDKGTSLYLRSSGGRSSLRSTPVDSLYVDEVSAIKALKLSQALSRIDASKDKTAMFVSTPDWPGRGISTMYLDGDCRVWGVLCQHCGERRTLRWEDFQLYEDSPERSFLRCPVCQTPRGPKSTWDCKWVASAKAIPGYESYHISQLASHTVSNSELAEKAIAAHRHAELLRNWTNETLGEDWLPSDANRLQLYQVRRCVRPGLLNATLIPRDRASVHILGLDQGRVNTFAIARVDFPIGSTRHPLDAAVMQVVAAGECAESDFETIRQLQRDWQVWVTVCDHAGSSARLAEEWARNSRSPSWLCRYVESNEVVEYMESQKASFPLVLCNRTWALSASQRRIKTGKITFPADLSDHWLSQIPNAALDTNGKRFLKVGADHLAHALAYCELGLHLTVKHFGSSIRWTRRAS